MTSSDTIGMRTDSRIYAFTDIDDTLIATERKLPSGVSSYPGAYDREGQVRSFFSAHQQTLLNILVKAGAELIPVTGRNTDALQRVKYQFTNYAAVSHGAVVLDPSGSVCPLWLEKLKGGETDWHQLLTDANQQVESTIRRLGLEARTRVIVDQGIAAYVSVKGTPAALQALNVLFQELQPLNLHINGHNAALRAAYTCKKQATLHILQHLDPSPDDLLVGLGDSVSDLPFMRECHFGVFPIGTQLDRDMDSEVGDA